MVIDPEVRNKRLNVPLSDRELGKLKQAANELGVPVSGLIRLIIWRLESCLSFLKQEQESVKPEKKGKGPSEG